MKKVLLFLVTLFLIGGGNIVQAQEDEIIDFDASFYHNWSEVSAEAQDNGAAVGDNIGVKLNEEVALSETIWGNLTGAVPYLYYANISEYSELRFEGTPGAVLRLMCNRVTDEGPIYEIKPTIPESGKLTVKISDLKYLNGGTACDFVCLQSIKVPAGWQGGTTAATITSIKLVKPGDPLSVPKESLKSKINEAKLYSSYAKTEASWNVLTTAIQAAENELKNASATAESLAAAQKTLGDAINGLTLQDGYTDLTADMFLKYSSVDNPGEGSAVGCAYDVRKSTGQPYGDGSVGELNWADLTEYDKLIVVVGGTIKPRFCMNRIEKDGQQAATFEESKMIDINPNNSFTWSTDAYQTVEGNAYIIDLKAIVADDGFARLHSIKKQGWGEGVVATDMLLYKEPVVEETDVTITMPEGYDDRTYSDEVALDFSTAEGLTAYIIVDVVDGATIMKEVTKVPANTGLYLVGKAGATYTVSIIKDFQSDEFKDNLLKSTINGVPKTEDGKTNYMLGTTSKGRGFHMLKKTATYEQTKNKAYLSYAADEANAPERLFIGEGEATRIANINVEKANGAWYTINGVKLNGVPTQKGMYIRNGNKVMIK